MTKSKNIKVPSQNLILDPRSKANVTRARNPIPTGDTVKVAGTRRMLSTKSKKATWF